MKNEKMKEILDFFRNNKKKDLYWCRRRCCSNCGMCCGRHHARKRCKDDSFEHWNTDADGNDDRDSGNGDNAADAAGRKYRAGSNAADYRIL